MTQRRAAKGSSLKDEERVRRRAPYLFAALLTLVPAQALPHFAGTANAASLITPDQHAAFAAMDGKKRLRLLIGMIKKGRHDLATALLERHPLEGPYAHNRTLFLEGLILKARKDYKAAAAKFRTALANDPNLTLVRVELAHTLVHLEQDDGARHHLQLLRGSAPTPETAKQFDNFIDAIDARRPWQLDGYVSMAPSTNFNNGTSQRFIIVNGLPFEISSNSQEKSGIGVRGGANGSYTLRLGKDLSFIAGAGINITEYDGRDFDDRVVSQSLSVRKRHRRGDVTVGAFANQRWSGRSEFVKSYGPQITLRQQLRPRLTTQTKLRHTIFDYKDTEFRNGSISAVENKLSYAVDTATVLFAFADGERGKTKQQHLDYWAVAGGVGVYREAPFGLTLYGETRVRHQVHAEPFPVLGFLRKDTRVNVSLMLTKRDFEFLGLAPQFQYTYVRNFSNSPFAKYESHGANITMTKKF